MRHKCFSLLLPLLLLHLLAVDGKDTKVLRHYTWEEDYSKTIPQNYSDPHPLNITASWNLRYILLHLCCLLTTRTSGAS